MIRYALKCPSSHVFESWFKSGDAFEALRDARMISCPICGEVTRDKAIMAPKVSTSRRREAMQKPQEHAPQPPSPPQPPAGTHALAAPASKAEAALAELRRQVQENSEYVGDSFAREARAIHNGEAPERSIYGEATGEDARSLTEDGIPVAPLPFIPTRKSN